MFTFTVPVFKHLVRRGSLRLMCRNVAEGKGANDLVQVPELGQQIFSSDSRELPTQYAAKCVREMQNPDDQQWKELIMKLNEKKMTNVSTKILQACVRLQNINTGMSYYNYLVKEGQELSVLDLMFFSKLLSKNKSEIPKYEDLIINLYNRIKDYTFKSPLIRGFIMEIFVEVPTCFEDIIKNRNDVDQRVGNLKVLEKALELDMIDVAYDYMNDTDFVASDKFIERYINFCIRMVEKGKFSVDFINNLIKSCDKKAITLNSSNLGNFLRTLVSALTKHQNEYHWSVSRCELSEKNVCSNCGLGLVPKSISDKDFENLKDHFFKNAFIRNSVYLTSSNEEINSFLQFLENCYPYDLVIDGLNMLYKHKHFGELISTRCLAYFLDRGKRVLTIGKKHSKTSLTKARFLNTEKNKRNAQFFFTSDLSDDDLFILYATLLRGLKTCFVTGDFFSSYSARLGEEMKCLFLRWQLSHQYLVASDGELLPPLPHCGLSQLTKAPTPGNDRYVWHISRQIDNRPKIHVGSPLEWHCLQSVKKN